MAKSIKTTGSPPHVREIQTFLSGRTFAYRITPACAGNTGTIQGVTIEGEDHPRMCGKYVGSGSLPDNILGSPPHVREILRKILRMCQAVGITPACAGNTMIEKDFRFSDEDHPRMCGKYYMMFCTLFAQWRITPACAGNTIGIL